MADKKASSKKFAEKESTKTSAETEASSGSTNIQNELRERSRDVWLAGLGALATVEEEGTKLFNTLIDRGKSFEESRRQQLEEATEAAEKQSKEALETIEKASKETSSAFADTFNQALERFGVPTRKEVDRLSEQVSRLSDQVDALAKALDKDDSAS